MTNDKEELARERKARRALTRMGYRLNKTPARSWLRGYYGVGFDIVDSTNTIVMGHYNGRSYQMTLEQVEEFVHDRQQTDLRAAA